MYFGYFMLYKFARISKTYKVKEKNNEDKNIDSFFSKNYNIYYSFFNQNINISDIMNLCNHIH